MLACALAASWAASRWLLGSDASVLGSGFGSGAVGRVLTGLAQAACVAAAAVVVIATLRPVKLALSRPGLSAVLDDA